MGQRLVISVVEDQERIATVYFHWSGYTRSVYEETKDLIKLLRGEAVNRLVLKEENGKIGFTPISSEKVDEPDTVLKLVRLFESLGGGLSSDSFAEFEKRYPGLEYSKKADRNNGLIDISEEGMANADLWAEATAMIDLDTEEVQVEPFWTVDEDDLEEDDVVVDLEQDPFDFTFDEIQDRYDMINGVDALFVRFEGQVYGFIE